MFYYCTDINRLCKDYNVTTGPSSWQQTAARRGLGKTRSHGEPRI